ncbi:MAG: guanylate kinase [Caulobacteraceae bacterium]|jgi:guanylate kinase|nr:guanylate kinase [Caulobacteraceae bacterium]
MSNSGMSNGGEERRRGLMLVISSPSGAGKTSLARRLVAEHPDLTPSVSVTTRKARPGEEDGHEYWFVTAGAFRDMVADGAFLEWAEVHEHAYGSPRAPVMRLLEDGRDVLFDIDWQGAQAIQRVAPEDTVTVFILPPTIGDLAKRLHTRAQDAEDVIDRRLGRARGEIEHWVDYDYVIVNDDFDLAYAKLASIYHAERLRRERNLWIEPLVARLLAEP